ncbi:hypothetical protein CLOP_g24461 [Closterium sp. NIES-67]|nr:hypothetical protein CLOP_g24461 [Closterium sp. NIES-67]
MSVCVAACASLQPCLDTCYVYDGWRAPPSLSHDVAFSIAGGVSVVGAAVAACIMASTLALDLPSLQALAGGRDKAARRKARAVLRVRRHGNLLLAALLLASCLASTLAAAAFTELLGVGWGSLCAFSLLFLCAEILPPALCTNRSLQVAGATAWAAMAALIVLFPAAWPVGLLLDWLVAGSGHTPDYGDGVVKCCLAPEPQQQEDDEGGGDACNPGERGGVERRSGEQWMQRGRWERGGAGRVSLVVVAAGRRAGRGRANTSGRGRRGRAWKLLVEGHVAMGARRRCAGRVGGRRLMGWVVVMRGRAAGVRRCRWWRCTHPCMPPLRHHLPSLSHMPPSLPRPPSHPMHLPPSCTPPPSRALCPLPAPSTAPVPPAPPPWFLQSWEHAAVWARLAAVPPTPVAPGALPGVSAPAVQAADRSAKARGGTTCIK